jgi:EAL domain-containing protein (putative c-di-GMP-specific phosphodiesterase class I)
VTTLRALERSGIRLVLDDFGTGYSSLGYLRSFPIHSLKVDRTFVAELGKEREGAVIVQAVTGMAHALGITVTAEGVEREEQLQILKAVGCEYGQGFYFHRPVRPERIELPTAA